MASLDAAGGSSSSSGGGAPEAATGFVVSGTLVVDGPGQPLAGASMCVFSTTHCTTTATDGTFSLDGVVGATTGVTGSKSGYVTGIWPLTPTADISGLTLRIRTNATGDVWAGDLGVSRAGGNILFLAYGTGDVPLSGVGVQSTPAGTNGYLLDAVDGGAPPMASGLLAVTGTSGAGLIFGLPAGTVTVTFHKTGVACAGEGPNGWTATQPNTMVVPVQAGSLTFARALCH